MTATEPAKLTQSEQTYIETIYELIAKHGYASFSTIATELKVKPPSVTSMLQKLDQAKYVTYSPYKGVVLTSKGKLLAKTLESRHYAVKRLLMMIGVSEEKAERDACEIEHKMDPDTSQRLTKFIKFIESAPKEPLFLQHFRHYCRTGERPTHCGVKRELS